MNLGILQSHANPQKTGKLAELKNGAFAGLGINVMVEHFKFVSLINMGGKLSD